MGMNEQQFALKELGKRLAARLDEDDWNYIEPFLREVESSIATLEKQRDGLAKDAEAAQEVIVLYEQLNSPFYKIIPMRDQIALRNLGYELKYLPQYADQPDPTYIVDWWWEVRGKHGASVTEARKWMYEAIDAALASAQEGGAK